MALDFKVMATMAKNLTVANSGLYDGFPSILIPSLIGLNQHLNPNEKLRITSRQASWIGKIETIA